MNIGEDDDAEVVEIPDPVSVPDTVPTEAPVAPQTVPVEQPA